MKKILRSLLTFILLGTLSLTISATDYKDVFKPKDEILKFLHDNTPLTPTKVFDNTYCIGSVSVTAWVIETSEGLILIDSMWDNRDAQLIIDGMKKLNLNPEELKYIIVTHGHRDHFGGADFLKNKLGAKVVMTETDNNYMLTDTTMPMPENSAKPVVDIFVKDKDKIVLGDTEVVILETPGHTPGGLSVSFKVKENGKEYQAVLWGGTGIPNDHHLQTLYKKSAEYFSEYTKSIGAEVELTAHLFLDNGYENLNTVNNLKEGEHNPFIIGKDGMDKYLDKLLKDINDRLAGK